MRVFYFGCIGDSGHYLFESDNCHDSVPVRRCRELFPFNWEDLDGQRFTPGREERGRWVGDQRQSVCKLTHEGGWTMLGCWDRSVDTRPGSNSTFVIEGTHDFATAMEHARAAFSRTFARINAAAPMKSEKA